MSVPPISATSPTTPTSPGGPVENPGALLDRDSFLKLLVAQLKYQDPTKPADTSQMVAQSAQLTMVDRLNEIAVAMKEAAASDKLALAGSLVGRDVSFYDDRGVEFTARVESVRFDNDVLTLMAGGYIVPLPAVTEVLAPVVAAVLPAVEPATVTSST